MRAITTSGTIEYCPASSRRRMVNFATSMFAHPSTACNKQNLNSVVVKPAQGEKWPLPEARRGNIYRIEGYANDGGGHEVQRVEISLDGGQTWLYCIRRFPDTPIRHSNKFWTWLHWHVDVEVAHLLRCKTISVRCWNVFKNTRPEHPNWNSMVCTYSFGKPTFLTSLAHGGYRA